MKYMLKFFLKFVISFVVLFLVSYLIHTTATTYFIRKNYTNIIDEFYLFNGVFTLVFITILAILGKRYKDQIGFIFLVISFFKIGIFLGLIKLNYIQINENLFLDFFIPYLICLTIEIYIVTKLVNSYN